MYEMATLDIVGHRGEQVPKPFFRQKKGSHHIAVVLPGFGYTCDMPLLYYSVLTVLDAGADVLQVEYAYNRREDYRDLPDAERERWLFADATASCNAALSRDTYSLVTLIGKSIGTRAMGHLLTADVRLACARVVWLTPLLHNERLRTQMRQAGRPSLFVIGTDDPHYDTALLAEVREASGGEAVVIQGGDHSLEIASNTLKSLDAMRQTIRALQALLANSERSMA